VSKKVFIKTFGCQMNEYDSDKMADVMKAAEGYEPTQNVDEADLILFNTCSVRERAQEKVFSDLGRVKHLKEKGVLIGVGGCVPKWTAQLPSCPSWKAAANIAAIAWCPTPAAKKSVAPLKTCWLK